MPFHDYILSKKPRDNRVKVMVSYLSSWEFRFFDLPDESPEEAWEPNELTDCVLFCLSNS